MRTTHVILYARHQVAPSQPAKLALKHVMKCVQCRDTKTLNLTKYLSNRTNFFIAYGRMLSNFHSDSCNNLRHEIFF